MIRVFIADDHDIVRSGVRRLLDDCADIEVVGEAGSLPELLAGAQQTRCDVVVLDVNMPGGGGPQQIKPALGLPSAPKVVIFSMYPEDAHAVSYLRAGASAYLSKRRASRELIDAVRTVAAGRRYITSTLAEYLFEQQIDLNKDPAHLLSERELEVVRGLAAGKRATEIADELGVSASTVNTYVQRIRAKLGVRTLVEIVDHARQNGLLG